MSIPAVVLDFVVFGFFVPALLNYRSVLLILSRSLLDMFFSLVWRMSSSIFGRPGLLVLGLLLLMTVLLAAVV